MTECVCADIQHANAVVIPLRVDIWQLLSRLNGEGIALTAIFEFYADESKLVERIMGRVIHRTKNTIHHSHSLKPSDSSEQDAFCKREDDVKDATEIKKRMNSYRRFMPNLRQILHSYCKGRCQ